MIIVFLFILGTAMGSFAAAVASRLHAHRNFVSERSECDHCHHKLAAQDLVPIVSWALLRGKCRYCHAKLAWEYPLTELMTGMLFVVSYIWWPTQLQSASDVSSFCFWLVTLVGVVILFLYDLKWYLLPDKIVFPLIGIAVLHILVSYIWLAKQGIGPIANAGAGIVVLAGFFGFLYVISKTRWIGFGDVKLGVFMGIMLGMPTSLIALLSSYYIAAIVVLPLLIAGKVKKESHVPFGPFLLASYFISFLVSPAVIHWFHGIFSL